MSLVKERNTIIIEKGCEQDLLCYHCGTPCISASIAIEDKAFCCEGCKLVYEILNQNGLCDYYKIQSHPGLSQIKAVRNDKYSYLGDSTIAERLYKFQDGKHVIVTLYIPGIHCSSCMWLLEHLYKIHDGVTSSRLNFSAKEVTIHFLKEKISLRQVVELLTTIGYEPYISLDDAKGKKASKISRARVFKLGIAGFCFGNIMMMSFPEYLSSADIEYQYAFLFRILNLILSIPVFFYCASEFFTTAWSGLKQRTLNIDAPIALALLITYSRSLYEIFSGIGAGYLDSMSGIVFFMLVGRLAQERTYRSLSFHRDYKSYFPIAVNRVTTEGVQSCQLGDLQEKDVVQLYNDEVIPADAIVLKGNARVDYSFVTGESEPVTVAEGKMVYAGGRQTGDQLTIQIVKPVAGSYLTSLWNHYAFNKNKAQQNDGDSVIHKLSRYFTIVLFSLAALTAIFWAINDPSKIFPSVSAMLIVACPCALLLSATYTNGNLLRIFSNNGLYLRDASVIEQLGNINHIVFDKTGTLTSGSNTMSATGHRMTDEEKRLVYCVVCLSKHPYSIALAKYLGVHELITPTQWNEMKGAGIEATIGNNKIMVGSAALTESYAHAGEANVFVRINDKLTAFHILPDFRQSIPNMIQDLHHSYPLSLLSGDHNKQKNALAGIFGKDSDLLFEQKPVDKLQYIEGLQRVDKKVLMIGDGLNDAGALQQSNVGITLADDINNFTPSCDAILNAVEFGKLPQLLKLAKASRQIVNISFVISILYNIIGLYISVRGDMEPMIAAILMPVSTLSIVLITTGISSLWAKRLRLSLSSKIIN
ncbi:heavy metal translocating P-type ATPase [Polluticoccus soli]|uniref:heavy metal translocating P-type ATPase n=1 Tax=Polluticoccus soli TaxID=3034150 RepID=UPI0023E293A7|nr:heavy metal translocating P-type ATPase metal-binding domain-containing protein [Flavipsychrobacter sp. JY13-12]